MAVRTITEPAAVGIARQRVVFETLSLLIPYDLPDERKIRIGEPGDGSYVIVDHQRPSQPVMSFGVGPSINFEIGMAERGHDVLMFDHTVEAPPATHERATWYCKGIAAVSNPAQKLFTLAEHMQKLPPGRPPPLLKMDIEGDEWPVIDAVAPDLLLRFDQVVLEVHDLQRIEEPGFSALAHRVFSLLASQFTLCHVHANNFCNVRVLAGCFPMPETLELSYIKTSLVKREPSRTFYPTAIDAPNFHQLPELALWHFPFLPGSDTIAFAPLSRVR